MFTSRDCLDQFPLKASQRPSGSARFLDSVVKPYLEDGVVLAKLAAQSSTGLAAIQITNYTGATPIALTRTSTKKEQLLEAGAAHVIATEEQDLVAEVMRITNGDGAHVIFDPVVGPTFSKLILALANQGIVYIYGNLSESDTQIPVLEFYPKMASIKGYGLFSITLNDALREVAVEYILKGLASGALKPVIDRTFKFDDMVALLTF